MSLESGAEGAVHPTRERASLATLSMLANDLAGELRLQPLLDRILRSAVELLGCDSGSLCLIDEAARTYRKEIDLKAECQAGTVFPLSEGVTGAVARTGGPVVFDRYGAVPGGHLSPDEDRYERPVVGVPIRLRRDLLGSLVVFGSADRRRFEADEVELLEGFATHAAIVIANSRLHEQAAERAKAVAVAEERERSMLEVHDTVGRGLASLILQLGQIQRELAPGHSAAAAVGRARDHAAEVLQAGRRAVWGQGSSHPRPLEESVRLELEWTQATAGVTTAFRTFGDPQPIAAAVTDQLLRIVQECLANAAQHARADLIRVGLVYGTDGIAVIVEDDGVGFDLAGADALGGTGVGLPGLVSRAAQVGGRVQIDSTPGWGTRVRADLPYRPRLRQAHEDETRLRVLLVHDQPLTRAGLVRLLWQGEPGVQVVAELAEAAAAVDAVRLLRPSVVLAGSRIIESSEPGLLETVRSAHPEVAVVVILDDPEAENQWRSWASVGVRGFVNRDADATALGRAVVAAARGDVLVVGSVLAQLGGLPDPEGGVRLTAREREVLALLKRGLADKQIATRLEISVRTVEKHVGHLLRKFGARSRTELVVASGT